MKIIQNCACLEFTITPNDSRVKFIKDILRGKKINSIYLYVSDSPPDLNVSPFGNYEISSIDDIINASMFLNLFDTKDKLFLKDFNFSNILISGNQTGYYIDYLINRIIDLDKSYINSKSQSIPGNIIFLLYVFYQIENKLPFNDEVNGSVTVNFPLNGNNIQEIKLSDFIDGTLREKKIKQIRFDGDCFGYLDLVSKNKIRIENFPLNFLSIRSNNEFYFDSIEIDYEKSFLKKRDNYNNPSSVNLTFIY